MDHGLPAGTLTVEITETVAMSDSAVTNDILTRLRIKGVHLSLDDFGTGYSSLLALLRFPFSELKLDRSFVQHCDHDAYAFKIVQAILSLARSFKMKTVAEGVESAPVAALLEEAGCEMAQGFYFFATADCRRPDRDTRSSKHQARTRQDRFCSIVSSASSGMMTARFPDRLASTEGARRDRTMVRVVRTAFLLAACVVAWAGGASAQTASCDRLRADIAALDGAAARGRQQGVGETIRRQRAELERTIAYSRSIGCQRQRFLIFGAPLPPNADRSTRRSGRWNPISPRSSRRSTAMPADPSRHNARR